ncbi:hypothetical protein [Flavobacterium pedocola]
MKPTNKLHYYLYTFCRYFSATMLLIYGFAKIIGTQFTTPLITYDTPVGALDGMELVWFYFGYSYPYAVFIALSQITASFFLFFRKTVRLGSVLFLCIMTNIVAVDIAFNVDFDAFIMAIILTCMGLFIFLSEFPLLIKYFISEPSLYQKDNMPNWINKIQRFKFIYIPVVFIGFFSLLSYVNNAQFDKNEFYGVWQLQKGNTKFYKIYFEGDAFQTVEFGKTEMDRKGRYSYDTKSKKIVFNSYPKDYIEKLYSQTGTGVTLDTTKREKLFQGKYELNQSTLKLKNENTEFIFKKIR